MATENVNDTILCGYFSITQKPETLKGKWEDFPRKDTLKMDIAAEPTEGRWEGEKEMLFFLEREYLTWNLTAYKYALSAKVNLHFILKEMQLESERQGETFLNKFFFK